MELILASTSPARRELLARLGVPFRCVAPGVDEAAFRDRGLAPRALAETLALAKARAVAEGSPQAVVIGCDQVATIDNQILGKPATADRASAQLALLAGRTHQLITAVAVIAGGQTQTHCDVTALAMRPLDHDAIARYVAAEAPLGCAGSYMIERRGIALFERIETADHTAIIGLPMIALCSMLGECGVRVI
jgi:septum formation protein